MTVKPKTNRLTIGIRDAIKTINSECGRLKDRADKAYKERNLLIALCSKIYDSSLERHCEKDKNWNNDRR